MTTASIASLDMWNCTSLVMGCPREWQASRCRLIQRTARQLAGASLPGSALEYGSGFLSSHLLFAEAQLQKLLL